MREERRAETRRLKIFALATVATIFFVSELLGERIPEIDRISHLLIVAYLGARSFVRDL